MLILLQYLEDVHEASQHQRLKEDDLKKAVNDAKARRSSQINQKKRLFGPSRASFTIFKEKHNTTKNVVTVTPEDVFSLFNASLANGPQESDKGGKPKNRFKKKKANPDESDKSGVTNPSEVVDSSDKSATRVHGIPQRSMSKAASADPHQPAILTLSMAERDAIRSIRMSFAERERPNKRNSVAENSSPRSPPRSLHMTTAERNKSLLVAGGEKSAFAEAASVAAQVAAAMSAMNIKSITEEYDIEMGVSSKAEAASGDALLPLPVEKEREIGEEKSNREAGLAIGGSSSGYQQLQSEDSPNTTEQSGPESGPESASSTQKGTAFPEASMNQTDAKQGTAATASDKSDEDAAAPEVVAQAPEIAHHMTTESSKVCCSCCFCTNTIDTKYSVSFCVVITEAAQRVRHLPVLSSRAVL